MLEKEQELLLTKLYRARQEIRQPFRVLRTANAGDLLLHPSLKGDHPVYFHDLEVLASKGYIATPTGPTNEFDLFPEGLEVARALVERQSSAIGEYERRPGGDTHSVWVVHGRNELARRAMFEFVRALGLRPMEWSHAVQETREPVPYSGSVVEAALAKVQAVIVVLTGDDEARLREGFQHSNDPDYERVLTPQARPNVLFEAGMAFGTHPRRTVIVELGRLRPFSDVAGRHVVRMDDTPARRKDLAQRLQQAGCSVDLTGNDWLSAGRFAAAR